jgi:hypothetical protein
MYVCMCLSPVEIMVRAFAYLSYFLFVLTRLLLLAKLV